MDRIFRRIVGIVIFAGTLLAATVAAAGSNASAATDKDLAARFAYLSTHGNSNCSRQFMESIPEMPVVARLQGSCCSPMSLHRYGEQVDGLKAFAALSAIPPDPYDIDAGLAAKLMSYYDPELTDEEQAAYDHAMKNSNEGGPCCCQCWRWHVYGGLAKHLIRDLRFNGEQVATLWDLSDGCGGESHVHHT